MKNKEIKQNLDFSKFERLISKLYFVMDSNQKDEKGQDMRMLDKRMAEMLAEGGETELANSIAEKAGIDADFSSGNREGDEKSKRFFIPSWLMTSLIGFMSILLVGFGLANILFIDPGAQPEDNLASDATDIPVITLKPKNITESGFIAQDNEFLIQFEGSLDDEQLEERIKVEPEIAFEIEVKEEDGETTIVVKPAEELHKDTSYKISIAESLTFSDGKKLEQDLSWVLNVEPSFKVLNTYPENNQTDIPLDSYIQFDLNQTIETEDLEGAISIEPKLEGILTSQGNKYIFIPSEKLSPDEEYLVSIDKSLAGESGELGEDYQFAFKTKGVEASLQGLSWINKDQVEIAGGQIVAEVVNPAGELSPHSSVRFVLQKVSLTNGVTHIIENSSDLTALPGSLQSVNSSTQTLRDKAVYQYEAGEEGVYLLTASVGFEGETITKYFIKSNLYLVGEDSGEFSEGYAYDAKSLQPVKSAVVKSYLAGELIGESKTGEDGKFSTIKGDLLTVESEEGLGLLSSSLSPSYFSAWDQEQESPYKSVLIQDSNQYAVGDTVYFDIYLYDVDGTNPNGGVRVIIAKNDSLKWYELDTDQVVYDQIHYANEGWISDGLNLPDQGEDLFIYAIVDNLSAGIHRLDFDHSIAQSKPDLSVEISKSFYFVGESITASFVGEGEAVVSVYKRAIPTLPEDSSSQKSLAFGELVEKKDLNLDETKQYSFTPLFDGVSGVGYTYTVTITPAVVSDQKQYLGQPQYSTVEVYRDPYKFDLHLDKPIAELGESIIADIESREIINRSKLGEVNFDLKVVRHQLEYERFVSGGDQSVIIGGRFYGISTSENIVLDKTGLQTDADGIFKMELDDMQPGIYDIVLTYAETEVSFDGAIFVPDQESRLLELGIGSKFDMTFEISENDNPLLKLGENSEDRVVVYWMDQILRSAPLDKTSGVEISSGSALLCIVGEDENQILSRSCYSR